MPRSSCAPPATRRRFATPGSITNQANAFQNLAITASVCLCGSDGSFDSMGEAMFCNFDGSILAQGGARPDEIVSAELRCDLVREAREGWGVENNPYQLGHRGYVAVRGGATDCPYTFMHDMVAGRYQLPWEARGPGARRQFVRLRAAGTRLRRRRAEPARSSGGAEAQGRLTRPSPSHEATPPNPHLMLRIIVTRLLAALPNLLGVVVITFILTRALPGDPAAYFAGGCGHAGGDRRRCARSSASTGRCSSSSSSTSPALARGDLGLSLTTGQPVRAGTAARLPASLELVLPGAAAGLRDRAAAGRAGGDPAGLAGSTSCAG